MPLGEPTWGSALWSAHQPAGGRCAVVCFPHGGAGASVFGRWAARLSVSGIRFMAYQPPGREWRWSEPPITSIREMAWEAAEAYAGVADPMLPTALVGNSMGALVAFETAYAFVELGLGAPELLVVAGMRAPSDRGESRRGDRALSDAAAECLDQSALLTDVHAVRAYAPIRRKPLTSAILGLRGRADTSVTHGEMLAWGLETSSAFERVTVEGGHIDLLRRDEAISAVVSRLSSDSARCP